MEINISNGYNVIDKMVIATGYVLVIFVFSINKASWQGAVVFPKAEACHPIRYLNILILFLKSSAVCGCLGVSHPGGGKGNGSHSAV